MGGLLVDVAPELRLFLPARRRPGPVRVACDGTSSLGHVVESVGVPLPEAGRLLVNGRAVGPSYRPVDGDEVRVLPVPRPQRLPIAPPRFLLDVHLGTLARRLRLVGVDTAYSNDMDDETLVARANSERRALLTQDRALLHRRKLWLGAYVYGSRPDDQLRDVLDRFAPRLAPWTRCTACNGRLAPVAKPDVAHLLQPGTRRIYDTFAQCASCGRPYWPGAHHPHLEALVTEAREIVAHRTPA